MNQEITVFNVLNSFCRSVASSANRNSPLTAELLFSHYFWLWDGCSLSEIIPCNSVMTPAILCKFQGKGGGLLQCCITGRRRDLLTLLPSVHINTSAIIINIIMHSSPISHFYINTTVKWPWYEVTWSLATNRFLNSIDIQYRSGPFCHFPEVSYWCSRHKGCSAFGGRGRSLLPPYCPRGLELPHIRADCRMCQQLVTHAF